MKKLFLIIGAPGSGKTTDAELVAEKNENITHYSTGDMLRAEVTSGSERGLELDSYMSQGEIVPIAMVMETIMSAIKEAPTDIILLDGYPRSTEQMNELDSYLANESSVELISVIEVEVSEETARNRVLGRSRGEDDKEEIFNKRMQVYLEPLIYIEAFYGPKDMLHDMSGEGTIEEVVTKMNDFIISKI
ncbi:adenylate kinase [Sulfurimonas sp. SAG-AH-194-I05]|nr:adenylate kinase [Sulfurimonas sp. SAG-AH-194-I05]MDF1875444.1 adenylate kinase [Sulfurimonas sp. SAG-AH-194-I05]